MATIDLSPADEAIANLVLGPLLVISNGFVFLVIVTSRSLRAKYSVLALILFVNFLTGLMCVLQGISALLDDNDNAPIPVHDCLTNPILLLDIFVIPMNSVTLLTLSADRLAAVARPVFYHKHSTLYVKSLILMSIALGIGIFVFFTAAMLIAPNIIVPDSCRKTHMMPPVIYSSYLAVRVVLSSLSIIFMIIVLMLLKRPHEALKDAKSQGESDFEKWQIKFTRTSLISNAITFVLFVSPSIIVITMTLVGYSQTAGITRYARLVNFLNCFNMLIVSIICQRDIRRRMKRFVYRLVHINTIRKFSMTQVTAIGPHARKLSNTSTAFPYRNSVVYKN